MTRGGFAALCLAAVALATLPACSSRKPKPEEPVKYSKRRQPPTIASLEGQAVPIQPDRPIPDAEQRARASYREFLKLAPGDPELAPEAKRRLGDLELEAGEEAQIEGGADQLQSSAYVEAVALYRQLLADHPDYARNDQVLYQLSRAQESGGDPLGALVTLDQLVARYPATELLAEVQFRRGEILFSRQRFRESEAAYAAVMGVGTGSDYYEQALYKQGWSQFKQGLYEEGLGSFFSLLDGRLGPVPINQVDAYIEALPRPERELLDDTLRVTSLSFAYLEGERSINEVLVARGNPGYGHVVYLSLASLYLDQKRYGDSAGVLMGFVDAQPLHPRSPYLMIQAQDALASGKFPTLVLEGREGYVQRFGLDQPFWQTHAPAVNQPAVDYLRDSVWILAQFEHSQAQAEAKLQADARQAKPGSDQARAAAALDPNARYAEAAGWYQRYLSYFPADDKAAETQFLLGEVRFESGDFRAAIAAYEATAYDYPAHARSGEAGYAALVAYLREEQRLEGPAKAATYRQRLDANLRFAAAFPEDPRSVVAAVDAADGLFKLGELDRAVTVAEGLVANPAANAGQKRVAWNVIALASFDRGQFAQAEAAFIEVRRLDQAAGRSDPAVGEQIAASIYRQGEQAREAGNAQVAADTFLRVAQTVPDASIRVTADYDAAMALMAAGETSKAIPVLQGFRKQHPDDPLSAQVTASLAVAYEQVDQPEAAARELERIAASPGNTPAERQEALWKAAGIYDRQGDAGSAARTYTQFIERYPEVFTDSLEAHQKLIDLADKRGDAKARMDWSQRLVSYDAQAGAQRSDRSRYLAARASLTLAEPTRQAYQAVQLKAPLKTSLQTKQKRLEAALAAYGRAADYGVAEVITASTYEIAQLYQGLAQALYRSDRPGNLDAAALEEYDLLLEEQAFPFEEKAIEIHEANVRRAAEGQYDPWVQKSYGELARLVPARYARSELGGAYVDAIR